MHQLVLTQLLRAMCSTKQHLDIAKYDMAHYGFDHSVWPNKYIHGENINFSTDFWIYSIARPSNYKMFYPRNCLQQRDYVYYPTSVKVKHILYYFKQIEFLA
jgi:hypothetical protein